MKIIRQGTMNRRIYTGICSKCFCEVECDENEISNRYDNGNLCRGVVICPCCGYKFLFVGLNPARQNP